MRLKKTTLLLAFSVISSFGYSQPKKIKIKERTDNEGKVYWDTTYLTVKKIEKSLDHYGEQFNDTIWMVDKKEENTKSEIFYHQTTKGNALLGLNFSNINPENSGLSFGYFIGDNFAFNLNGGYNFSSKYFKAAISLRPYFGSSENGRFFLESNLGIEASKASTSTNFGLGSGYDFFINKNVAFELNLGYNKKSNQDGEFGFGMGFLFFISNKQ